MNSEGQKGLIGQVYNFDFMDEKTFKNIKYKGNLAYVAGGGKVMGVQCVWFVLDKHRKVSVQKNLFSHGYIDITNYVVTIPSPVKENGDFYISNDYYSSVKKIFRKC